MSGTYIGNAYASNTYPHLVIRVVGFIQFLPRLVVRLNYKKGHAQTLEFLPWQELVT